jgi:hypothetical protein
MTTHPHRSSPAPPLERVRISAPGEIAAAVPQLLGFRPTESAVLICLSGPRRRVGLTVRADLPDAGREAAFAGTLVAGASTGAPDAVIAVLVSEAPDPPGGAGGGPDLPHRLILRELTRALTRMGIPLGEALLVRNGRWWSYDCVEGCCRPGAGTALPGGVTALAAASVAAGVVLADSREELARRIGADPARRVLVGPGTPPRGDDWAVVAAALRLCVPGAVPAGIPLPDDVVAGVLRALQDVGVRDRALALALDDAPAAEALWTECTRRAPEEWAAPPATLLAVGAWLRGDGAMAGIALERALDSDPGYRLARLLRPALAACLPPAELAALIAEAAGATADR